MKIFYLGKEVRDSQGRFSSLWKKTKWFLKRVAIGVVTIFFLASIYVAGGYGNPVVKAELIKSEFPPILTRIAKCESPTGHWKNGQVIININNNGSYDQGKYQINSIWNKKATEMQLNLTIETDNEKFAEFLYATRGTGDWSSSAKCWQK